MPARRRPQQRFGPPLSVATLLLCYGGEQNRCFPFNSVMSVTSVSPRCSDILTKLRLRVHPSSLCGGRAICVPHELTGTPLGLLGGPAEHVRVSQKEETRDTSSYHHHRRAKRLLREQETMHLGLKQKGNVFFLVCNDPKVTALACSRLPSRPLSHPSVE